MTTDRDPRANPIAGDIIDIGGEHYRVHHVRLGHVFFCRPGGEKDVKSIGDWVRFAKFAHLVFKAEG